MRLIDADKVKEHILKEGFYCDTKEDKEATAKEIDSLFPTVKAISIDWLKKFANERAKNEEEEGYWHIWGTDLLQMITQWEKENGTNV